MTSEDFKLRCKKLYGPQSNAAFALGISISTLKRWFNGESEIPKTAWMALDCAEHHKASRRSTFNNHGSLSHKATPNKNIGFVK